MHVPIFAEQLASGGRRVAVLVSEEFFAGWFAISKTDEWTTLQCVEGLPEGARLVAVIHEPTGRMFRFLFEHESFRELLPGERPPDHHVRFKKRS